MTIEFTAPAELNTTVENGNTHVTLDSTTYQNNLPEGITMEQADTANGSLSSLANLFLTQVTNNAPEAEQFTASMEAGSNVFHGTFQRGEDPSFKMTHSFISVK